MGKIEKAFAKVFSAAMLCLFAACMAMPVFAEEPEDEDSGGELTFSGLPFRLNRGEDEETLADSESVPVEEEPAVEETAPVQKKADAKEVQAPAQKKTVKKDVPAKTKAVPVQEEVIVETAAEVSAAVPPENAPLVQGLVSYHNKDWAGACVFLRRAMLEPGNDTAEIRYMLIMSQMYAQDYTAAISDSGTFLSKYAGSPLAKNVQYQRGRALHYVGQNDKSVLLLSDFCHQNPKSPMYPSALYWIAECFYDDYNFDTARSLYEQIVNDYPDDRKAVDARFKLDAIAQREREQKLLNLLRETGEDYLSTREDYERQLKEYETEDIVTLRRQLNEANERISELESAENEKLRKASANAQPVAVQPAQTSPVVKAQASVPEKESGAAPSSVPAKAEPAAAKEPSSRPAEENVAVEPVPSVEQLRRRRGISDEELLKLKIRAAQLQRMLDERYSSSAAAEEGEW